MEPPGALEDHALAADIADSAGLLLLTLRARMGHADAAALRDAGDAHSHEHIAARLREERPDDAVLSEESPDDLSRLEAPRVWIVDPLDGTREYGEAGRSDWAVHVALWSGGDLVAGAVALPAQDRTLRTGAGAGLGADASLAGPAGPPAYSGAVRIVVSRTRAPGWVVSVAGSLGATVAPLGSAGAKIAAVVVGEAEVYLHAGGQHEWDSAAPVAVARAAGFHCSRLDGSPLRYNRRDTLVPDLVVCRPELADAVLAAVAGHTRG